MENVSVNQMLGLPSLIKGRPEITKLVEKV